MALKERAKQLKKDIPAVLIALKDRETPLYAKIMAGITVVYALSPIDLIPDFIPVLGYLDDLLILPGLVFLTIKMIPKEIWNISLQKAEGMWKDGRPKNWWCAIPVIAIWGSLIIWMISKCSEILI